MRRRRRAAWGPVGGKAGVFILDVIIQQEYGEVNQNILGSREKDGSGEWKGAALQKQPGSDREVLNQPKYAVLRRHHERRKTSVNELLTHYTRLPVSRSANLQSLLSGYLDPPQSETFQHHHNQHTVFRLGQHPL